MKILSLFDGISCARVALERAGIPVEAYYASEVDKYAIQISKKNWPDIIQLGDVKFIAGAMIKWDIDLLIGGSPCQDLSIAKKNRQGLAGERSGLFWEYVRILNEVKPKYFILENVASMPKEAKQVISETLGVEPVMINASLVSAQNRKRLFWVGKLSDNRHIGHWDDPDYHNIFIPQPDDCGILLKDILEKNVDDSYFISTKTANNLKNWNNAQAGRVRGTDGKSVTLQAGGGGTGAKTGLYAIKIPEATKKGYALATEGQSVDLSFPTSKTRRGRVGDKVKNIMTSQSIGVVQNMQIRKLTPIECERLQGLPDNYTEGVSNTQRYKALGNAFNVDVVTHILKSL